MVNNIVLSFPLFLRMFQVFSRILLSKLDNQMAFYQENVWIHDLDCPEPVTILHSYRALWTCVGPYFAFCSSVQFWWEFFQDVIFVTPLLDEMFFCRHDNLKGPLYHILHKPWISLLRRQVYLFRGQQQIFVLEITWNVDNITINIKMWIWVPLRLS